MRRCVLEGFCGAEIACRRRPFYASSVLSMADLVAAQQDACRFKVCVLCCCWVVVYAQEVMTADWSGCPMLANLTTQLTNLQQAQGKPTCTAFDWLMGWCSRVPVVWGASAAQGRHAGRWFATTAVTVARASVQPQQV